MAALPFPDKGGHVFRGCADIFIKTVMDDVHLAAHAPGGPGDSLGKVDHLRIRLVKLDIKELQYSIGEPGHILRGARHELIERGDLVNAHEFGEAGVVNIVLVGFPDDRTRERWRSGHMDEAIVKDMEQAWF